MKVLLIPLLVHATSAADLDQFFLPPPEHRQQFGQYKSLLRKEDGTEVRTAEQWPARREEIRRYWESQLGTWPPLLEEPTLEVIETIARENFLQQKVRVQVAPRVFQDGYLLLPERPGPHPAVVVPFYDPETSVGLNDKKERAFAYQLTRRGFATLSIGSPGGDARKPDLRGVPIQPLHYLGYLAANCARALEQHPRVLADRIGIVGHSYGGKWALFAAAFYPNFACAAVSDPGIVFDEPRPNVNYWEPWYLGFDPATTRKPGLITPENPRTGPYKTLIEQGRDLHEIIALIAPRPFLVSGGSEDPPSRWRPLNRVNEVYQLLGAPNRLALTTRPTHDPTPESNTQLCAFFDKFLDP